MIRVSKLNIIIFVLLIALISVIAYSYNNQDRPEIKFVNITGARYLDVPVYMEFAKLNSQMELSTLTVGVIKDRIEKHPYVNYADVIYSGNGKVEVEITEKKFDALLISDNSQYLIDEYGKLVPFILMTSNLDVPLLVNSGVIVKGKINKSIVKGLQILSAAKLLNENLYSSISEIDLGKGSNTKIRFLNNNFFLNIGTGNEIYKITAFEKIYDKLLSSSEVELVTYIEMKFDNQICIGFKSNNSMNGENRI